MFAVTSHKQLHTCLQEHLCKHAGVMQRLQESESLEYPPTTAQSVCNDTYPEIVCIFEHESQQYQHSFISTARGRARRYVFLNTKTSCLVNVFRRHKQWRVQCMSSRTRSHFGSRAQCCKTVYDMILATPKYTCMFDPILDPTEYIRIRVGFDRDDKFTPVQVWTAEPELHIRQPHWSNGRFREPFPEGLRPPEPYIIPGYREGFSVCDGTPSKCRLVSHWEVLDVDVKELVNDDGVHVTVWNDGPSCGLFWSSSLCAQIGWVYDVDIMYKTKLALFHKNSSIQLEYDELRKDHLSFLQAKDKNAILVNFPSLAQFNKHYQRFIHSQVEFDVKVA